MLFLKCCRDEMALEEWGDDSDEETLACDPKDTTYLPTNDSIQVYQTSMKENCRHVFQLNFLVEKMTQYMTIS